MTIALGDAPPTEFRLFVSGWNKTENGDFLFDADAAQAVMAAYAAWGVDLAIDLEHQMLDSGPSPDPTARDARGWCKLELRADGSLWAVDVKWTADGSARLSEKRQRYVSPAFEIDPKTKRVTKIINVAITAIPATHETPALIAASLKRLSMLSAEAVQKALDALIAGDAEACQEILKGMIADAASAEEGPADAPPEAPPMADSEAPPPAPPADDEEKKAMAAATARLVRVTGSETVALAFDVIEAWKASHAKLEAEAEKLAKEKEAIDLGQRKENAKKLIALGAETPHTSGLADGKLCKRLFDEPLKDQNERVAALLAARGGKLPAAPKPPVGDSYGLDDREIAKCKKLGVDPKKYSEVKASMMGKV